MEAQSIVRGLDPQTHSIALATHTEFRWVNGVDCWGKPGNDIFYAESLQIQPR